MFRLGFFGWLCRQVDCSVLRLHTGVGFTISGVRAGVEISDVGTQVVSFWCGQRLRRLRGTVPNSFVGLLPRKDKGILVTENSQG